MNIRAVLTVTSVLLAGAAACVASGCGGRSVLIEPPEDAGTTDQSKPKPDMSLADTTSDSPRVDTTTDSYLPVPDAMHGALPSKYKLAIYPTAPDLNPVKVSKLLLDLDDVHLTRYLGGDLYKYAGNLTLKETQTLDQISFDPNDPEGTEVVTNTNIITKSKLNYPDSPLNLAITGTVDFNKSDPLFETDQMPTFAVKGEWFAEIGYTGMGYLTLAIKASGIGSIKAGSSGQFHKILADYVGKLVMPLGDFPSNGKAILNASENQAQLWYTLSKKDWEKGGRA